MLRLGELRGEDEDSDENAGFDQSAPLRWKRGNLIEFNANADLGITDEENTDLEVKRSHWTILTPNQYTDICWAIQRDVTETIVKFFEDWQQNNKKLYFPVSVRSRNGDFINSKAMNIAHLMALFVSKRTLETLHAKQILPLNLFRRRCDLEIEDVSKATTFEDETIDIPLNVLNNMPSIFMTTFTDNVGAFLFIFTKCGNREIITSMIDSAGRNLLHSCIDEESPRIFTLLLSNRRLLGLKPLYEMLRMKESMTGSTPFIYAMMNPEPTMLNIFLQASSKDFTSEHWDLSGIGRSVFNCLLSQINDPGLCLQLIKEYIKNGGRPDQYFNDRLFCLETCIMNPHFTGADLRRIIQLLLKHEAKTSGGAFVRLLRSPFRSNDEILDIGQRLLRKGKSRVLLAGKDYDDWVQKSEENKNQSGVEALDPIYITTTEAGAVFIQMFKEKRLSVPIIRELCQFIQLYADITIMLLDPDGIASAVSQRIMFNASYEQSNDLDGILDLIIGVTGQTRYTKEAISQLLHRILFGLLRALFERNDFTKVERPYDKILTYIQNCLEIMEKRSLDFNIPVDGQIGLFSLFSANVPDEAVPKFLEILPVSFDVQTQNLEGENLATLTIKRFRKKFAMIDTVFRQLKAIHFDFKQKTRSGETILMTYVRTCGKVYEQMQKKDVLRSNSERDFFKVLRFLYDEEVDFSHHYKRSADSDIYESALSAAMELTTSIIAEEIIKVVPTLLNKVSEDIFLTFIQNCPEVLEFFHCRQLYHRTDDEQGTGTDIHMHHLIQSRLNSKTLTIEELTELRAIWVNYIQHHHWKILDIVIKEPERNLSKVVEKIYDYLIHSDYVGPRKNRRLKTLAMEFSVFENPKEDEGFKVKECVNAPLLMKIVETDSVLERHPLFTEYFEKFYRTAFFNSIIFILYHILFLIVLNGYIINVITPVTNYAFYSPIYKSGHYICHINNCTMASLSPEQQSHVHFPHEEHENCTVNPKQPQCFECFGYTVNQSLCSSSHDLDHNHCPFTMHIIDLWLSPMVYVLMILSALGLLRETIQMIMDPLDYLKTYIQNPIEVSMFLFAFLFSLNITDCPINAGFKENWQFRLGVVAVFNSWILMFLYMSKFPAFATYVIMFTHAVKSGIKLLLTFSWLLLGFGFIFHLLLGNQIVYRRFYTSLNKVWLMMIGEIDYNGIVLGKFEDPEDNTKQLHFEYVTRVMLSIFVLLINIVLMNLFVGLIVGDVHNINKAAHNKKWEWNLKFTVSIDYLRNFLNDVRKKLDRCCGSNKDHSNDPLHKERMASGFLLQKDRIGYKKKASKKMGLSITKLYLTNIFKWKVVAMFFGFVRRKELIHRVQSIDDRKNKLYYKYQLQLKFQSIDQIECTNERKVTYPIALNPWKLVKRASVTDSYESIPDDPMLIRRLYKPENESDEEDYNDSSTPCFKLGAFSTRYNRIGMGRLTSELQSRGIEHPIGHPFPSTPNQLPICSIHDNFHSSPRTSILNIPERVPSPKYIASSSKPAIPDSLEEAEFPELDTKRNVQTPTPEDSVGGSDHTGDVVEEECRAVLCKMEEPTAYDIRQNDENLSQSTALPPVSFIDDDTPDDRPPHDQYHRKFPSAPAPVHLKDSSTQVNSPTNDLFSSQLGTRRPSSGRLYRQIFPPSGQPSQLRSFSNVSGMPYRSLGSGQLPQNLPDRIMLTHSRRKRRSPKKYIDGNYENEPS